MLQDFQNPAVPFTRCPTLVRACTHPQSRAIDLRCHFPASISQHHFSKSHLLPPGSHFGSLAHFLVYLHQHFLPIRHLSLLLTTFDVSTCIYSALARPLISFSQPPLQSQPSPLAPISVHDPSSQNVNLPPHSNTTPSPTT